jgi:hypothetical protein
MGSCRTPSWRSGNATVMFADRRPGWPFIPSLLQVYVDDVEATLNLARQLGATVVTEPTDFFGDTFSRLRDPWSNLWWVYRHGGQAWAGDEQSPDWTDDAAGAGAEEWDQASPEMTYIHDTLMTVMPQLQDLGRQCLEADSPARSRLRIACHPIAATMRHISNEERRRRISVRHRPQLFAGQALDDEVYVLSDEKTSIPVRCRRHPSSAGAAHAHAIQREGRPCWEQRQVGQSRTAS